MQNKYLWLISLQFTSEHFAFGRRGPPLAISDFMAVFTRETREGKPGVVGRSGVEVLLVRRGGFGL